MAISPTELGYAEITADATTASTSYGDVSGLTTTVTVGTRPIIVIFDCSYVANTIALGGVAVRILEDGVAIGVVSQLINLPGALLPFHRELRRAPAAGSHTYKAQVKAAFGGTVTIKADTGENAGPASLHVLQL